MTKLLELRKQISKRRPNFIQQDTQKRKEVKRAWRRPKGMHSKMRDGVWGRPACVNSGYRGPAETRGLTSKGLIPVEIYNTEQLENIDSKKQTIILGHIGAKKKITLLNICKQKGITVLNVKNPEEKIRELTEKAAARKEAKKALAKEKEEKTKQTAPAKKEEPQQEKTKEQERKEVEKILTKKE